MNMNIKSMNMNIRPMNMNSKFMHSYEYELYELFYQCDFRHPSPPPLKKKKYFQSLTLDWQSVSFSINISTLIIEFKNRWGRGGGVLVWKDGTNVFSNFTKVDNLRIRFDTLKIKIIQTNRCNFWFEYLQNGKAQK